MVKRFRLFAAGVAFSVSASLLGAAPTWAGPREDILAGYAAAAKAVDPAFKGFNVKRGEAFYYAVNTGGAAETPSCATCHGKDPTQEGHLRTGRSVDPMAVSANPDVFTRSSKVEKWFGRECKGVMGRDCTALEKGDFITFLASK